MFQSNSNGALTGCYVEPNRGIPDGNELGPRHICRPIPDLGF